MSTELTYSQVEELLPAYALGALEPEELLAVDTYVRRHPELEARLHALEEAAAQLAYAAPDAALPPHARQRMLTRARADMAAPVSSRRTNSPAPPEPAAGPQLGKPPARRRFSLAGLSRWAAFGAAAAAVVLALYVGQVQAQLNNLNQQISTMHDTVVALSEQVRVNQEVIALLADRGVELAGTPQAPGASAEFYLAGDKGTLVARGLAPLPAVQTYQLWLVIDGKPTPFGVFQAQAGQSAVLTVVVPPSARGFAIVDVSIEPAGGSQQITKETIVLRGQVS
jgi:anti-sigma-K factor RskA